MKPYRIQRHEITDSTNDDAKKAAGAGEAEGLVVWALEQKAGRGRHGRSWISPQGNLYCSILLRPSHELQTFGQYSFVAALALCDLIDNFLPQSSVTLKWPNDVLVDGKKIGGILLEAGDGWVVVGIGLNVLHHPDEVLYPSTSLYAEAMDQIELVPVLEMLLDSLWRWYEVIKAEGFTPIRLAWLEHAEKGPLSVRLPQETIKGTFKDLGKDGSLILLLADGSERAIASGDVFTGT
ncbi:MAG: biotin--[acetyl-CoA-carboxylase] ligase [Alphaproteobacteria bacterium]